jgi:SHS2 domain-containing protein
MTSWEHFDHDADIGVRGYGATQGEAFAQAALALTALYTSLDRIEPRQAVTIECEARDPRVLLTDFLNSVVFEASSCRRVFARFDVRIEGGRLVARATGEALDRSRHPPGVDVKGATFTSVSVQKLPNGTWLAQCVVDV